MKVIWFDDSLDFLKSKKNLAEFACLSKRKQGANTKMTIMHQRKDGDKWVEDNLTKQQDKKNKSILY